MRGDPQMRIMPATYRVKVRKKERLEMRKCLVLGIALMSLGKAAYAIPQIPAQSTRSLLYKTGWTDCRGPIATEKHPIVGENLLTKMRREGKLPDKFVCGRCEYDLAGDPGAAYYVKRCR